MNIKTLLTGCKLLFVLLLSCQKAPLKEVSQFEINHDASDGLYHTLNGVYAKLNKMKDTSPEIVQLYSLGRSADQQRHIPLVRMSFNPELVLSKYLFVAGTHGDAASGVEALVYIMNRMLTLDETTKHRLRRKGVTIYFVPVHNPDGFAANQRENGNDVDLNRNFPFGYTYTESEPETEALVSLINTRNFSASIFFHSANEERYENLVRVPVELGKGQFAPNEEAESPLWRLAHLVKQAGNELTPLIPWHCSDEMVDASGIAADWCSSGLMGSAVAHRIQQPCLNSHPAVTVELCFPKQPMDAARLQKEKEEALKIVLKVITEF